MRVLDDLSSGKKENLRAVAGAVELTTGSILDDRALRFAVEGVQYVVHLAANPFVVTSIQDPLGTDRTNIYGTLALLLAARDARVHRVVFASSCAVYGNAAPVPAAENSPTAPASPYALSKLAGEHYCRLFTSLYGLPAVALRFFNIFGPRQDPSSAYSGVISLFIDRMLRGDQPMIFGDGEQTRDFIYVTDAVAAILAASENEGMDGEVLNIGTGRQRTIRELCETLARLTRYRGEPAFGPPRDGEVRRSQADITRARSALGFEPAVELEQGLRLTCASVKSTLRS